jgi:hypothetical protein
MDPNPYESPKTIANEPTPQQPQILTGLIVTLALSFAALAACWLYLSVT